MFVVLSGGVAESLAAEVGREDVFMHRRGKEVAKGSTSDSSSNHSGGDTRSPSKVAFESVPPKEMPLEITVEAITKGETFCFDAEPCIWTQQAYGDKYGNDFVIWRPIDSPLNLENYRFPPRPPSSSLESSSSITASDRGEGDEAAEKEVSSPKGGGNQAVDNASPAP
ncbi:uncharacterized protein G2W53_029231 [Senna tora]|uniref:Uncharacterized protein n=1 Tax=Senna tora TaxID=362788 RepID=A0A834T4T2_9FABA|nr:uncharacterized protein G2W53_029231 [Senna tora]